MHVFCIGVSFCLLSKVPKMLSLDCLQSQEASQLPTQQQFVKHKLAAFEAQRLARYNTIMEAQTVAHLEKLDRVIAKATKRSQERQANQYTLEAKAKLLEKQQEQIQSTLQELDNEQSDVRRRHDFCLRQANHNKTQTGRAQVSFVADWRLKFHWSDDKTHSGCRAHSLRKLATFYASHFTQQLLLDVLTL